MVHRPLMGGLLHLVQQGGDWAGPQPAHASPRCTNCNSPPINGPCTTHLLLYKASTVLLFLVCVSRTITGQPRNSLFIRSVAEISRHSLLSGFDNVGHCLGLTTRTQISVCKSPFPSAGTAVSQFRAKTVQQRPLLPREVETRYIHT